jgi:hypothetical protein
VYGRCISPARRQPMLTTATPAGAVSLLEGVFMAFALPYLLSVTGRNPRSGLRNRRWRRHGIVIFLKTPSRPSGVRAMQQMNWGEMPCRWWPRSKA